MIFDTHVHGYWEGLAERRGELLESMRAAGVARTAQIGANWETSEKAVEAARAWGPGHVATVGFHPSDCQDLPPFSAEAWVSKFEKLAVDNRDVVRGIGEIGLDYHHLEPGREDAQKLAQHAFFRAQCALADRLGLPAVIHTRNAALDTLRALAEYGPRKFVLHCFSEDLAFARSAMALPGREAYVSFSGILTYKKSDAQREAAKALPLDRIMVETDSPFLPPQAVRKEKKTCEPAFVRYVLDELQALRAEPHPEVEKAVWDNANRFYMN